MLDLTGTSSLVTGGASGLGEATEAFKDKLRRDVLFPRRLGRADELASMVVELLTNSYANAEVVRLDGGARLQPK